MWAGCLPSWSQRGVRRAAGGGAPGLGVLPCGDAGRSIRAAAGGHPATSSVPAASRFTVSSFAASSRVKATFRCASLIPTSASVRYGDGGRFQQRGEAVGGRGPVEQAEQPQHGEGALPLFVLLLILPSGVNHSPYASMTRKAWPPCSSRGFLQLHEVALADVPGVGVVRGRCRGDSR